MGYTYTMARNITQLAARTREKNLNGIEFVSAGACPGCQDCFSWKDEDDSEITYSDIDSVNDGFFSWSSCDLCGSTLGGTRYPVHGIDRETKEIVHFNVCLDCYEICV